MKLRRATSRITALTAALALGACSDAPRCKPIERCDVRAKSCQRAALQHAICLRGRDESADLEISVVTLERSAYLEEAEQAGEEESEAQQQMRSGLALFGLSAPPSERDEARVSRARLVGGYYDSDERRITLIDDGRDWRGAGNVLTLVHEMLHALQDAAGQLSGDDVHSLDQARARSALVEGEATLLSDEAAAEGYGFSFSDLDYGRALARYRSRSLSSLAASESLFDVASMYFPYAFGASYLWPLRHGQGAGALGQAFETPPVSVYAVMNADPEQPGLLENDLAEVATPVLPDRTLVGCYHLGRFLYEARVRAGYLALPFDVDYVADTLCVFVDAEASVSAIWRIRFASEAAADWATADSPVVASLTIDARREGNDVWWPAGFTDSLPKDLSWETAPADDFGFERDDPERGRIECPHRMIDAETLR